MVTSKPTAKSPKTLPQDDAADHKSSRPENSLGHFLKSKPRYQLRHDQASNASFELGYN
jgi:hypothetical protein